MNAFDQSILGFFNGFAGRSWALDRGALLLSHSDILQSSVPLAVFWWAWFLPDPDRSRRRGTLLSVLAGTILALVICRLAVMGLPFRPRPIHTPGLEFVLPFGMNPESLRGWSTFPSDHATFSFALAAGLWFVSRAAGMLLLAQAAILVCLPRIYLGLHFPTDILAGAAIGTTVAWTMTRPALSEWLARPLLAWEAKRPALFYPALVLLCLQLADLMREARTVAEYLLNAFRAIGPS
jgi:undecaprenyl-diphosphatase